MLCIRLHDADEGCCMDTTLHEEREAGIWEHVSKLAASLQTMMASAPHVMLRIAACISGF